MSNSDMRKLEELIKQGLTKHQALNVLQGEKSPAKKDSAPDKAAKKGK